MQVTEARIQLSICRFNSLELSSTEFRYIIVKFPYIIFEFDYKAVKFAYILSLLKFPFQ